MLFRSNSISEKDIPLQIKPSISEFKNILSKLNVIKSEKFKVDNKNFDGKKLDTIIDDLDKNKIKKAFSNFYYLIKKNEFIEGDSNSPETIKKILKIYRIFYGKG